MGVMVKNKVARFLWTPVCIYTYLGSVFGGALPILIVGDSLSTLPQCPFLWNSFRHSRRL